MKWEKVAIKDVADGIFDGPHATPPISVDGGVFLGISNITKDGHLDLSDIKYISKHDLKKWTKRVTPSKGDIVFSYEATLNLYAMIPEDFFGCLGRRMGLIRPNEDKAIGKFLYYYFFSPEWRRIIAENTVTGSTVDRIPLVKFPEFKIELPSLTTQQRIASILSAYDDHIENNQKQIKLLEEAAQRLYKEWFVDLRFPGHESVKIVDGVPEGWKKINIGSLLDVVKRTKQVKTSDLLEKGAIPVIDQSKKFIAGYTDDYETLINTNLPAIVFGDHTRVLKYVQFPFAKGADGTQIIISNNEKMPQVLFYCGLINIDLSNYSYARHFKYLKEQIILVPTESVAVNFSNIANKWYMQIEKLRQKTVLLQEARDRLLPKLMSGEIEV